MMRAMRRSVLFMLALATGCGGSARWVVRDPGGGLLALEGEHEAARADAQQKIEVHCGTRPVHIVFEGEIAVRDEETHERTMEDRVESTRLVQSGDHTTWVEGQPAYGESGVTLPIDGEPSLYDTSHATRQRTYRTHMESRIEYECDDDAADEDDGIDPITGEPDAPEDEAPEDDAP